MEYRKLGKKMFWWPIIFFALVLAFFIIANTLLGAADPSVEPSTVQSTINNILRSLGIIAIVIGLPCLVVGAIFYLIAVFKKTP